MITKWTSCKNTYAKAVYNQNLPTGASRCLSSACVEAATIYTNNIVKNYEIRLLKFLKYRLQIKKRCTIESKYVPFLKNLAKEIAIIAEKYCYQYICAGSPK